MRNKVAGKEVNRYLDVTSSTAMSDTLVHAVIFNRYIINILMFCRWRQ
jgi:hypothetical protein